MAEGGQDVRCGRRRARAFAAICPAWVGRTQLVIAESPQLLRVRAREDALSNNTRIYAGLPKAAGGLGQGLAIMQRGKPRFEATDAQRELVRALLVCGVSLMNVRQHVINPATGRPLNYRTFKTAFAGEIEIGVDQCTARVACNLFRIATLEKESAPVVTAIIFWLRTKGGWRYADEATAYEETSDSRMVGNEENARRIIEDVMQHYGRARIMTRD